MLSQLFSVAGSQYEFSDRIAETDPANLAQIFIYLWTQIPPSLSVTRLGQFPYETIFSYLKEVQSRNVKGQSRESNQYLFLTTQITIVRKQCSNVTHFLSNRKLQTF